MSVGLNNKYKIFGHKKWLNVTKCICIHLEVYTTQYTYIPFRSNFKTATILKESK